jgi:hypothetical protein
MFTCANLNHNTDAAKQYFQKLIKIDLADIPLMHQNTVAVKQYFPFFLKKKLKSLAIPHALTSHMNNISAQNKLSKLNTILHM